MTLTFLLIGFAAGILSGLFGIGGGIVIVPALLYFGKFAQQSATGTSLGALLLPVGLLGAYTYWKAGHVDVKASALIATGLFFGAYLGARVALGTSGPTLKRAFAVFLVLVAAKLFWDTRPASAAPAVVPPPTSPG
ncbi:MAG: sulfite exporter TauE/SafE family protein [Gemmatimonadaceae bacterium]|nr:sulfite exporter TauE/SafE family protein [Gemmatimonadaceae bacterium]